MKKTRYEGSTLRLSGIGKGTVIFSKQTKKWRARRYYIVNVAFSSDNIIHRAFFYSGFLQDGVPCGYNGFARFGCDFEKGMEIADAYFIEVLEEVELGDRQ